MCSRSRPLQFILLNYILSRPQTIKPPSDLPLSSQPLLLCHYTSAVVSEDSLDRGKYFRSIRFDTYIRSMPFYWPVNEIS